MNVLNQLNKDDAQKTLTNVLSVLKQHGEMFAYESQWKTADGSLKNNDSQKRFEHFLLF